MVFVCLRFLVVESMCLVVLVVRLRCCVRLR